MAYFERVDTRNDGNSLLVLCNICKVNCAERSITTHKTKCRAKHAIKFKNGELELCAYDSSHIVVGGQMDIHLEFCNKRQSVLVSEFQEACAKAIRKPIEGFRLPEVVELNVYDDAWNRDDNVCEKFVAKLGQLKLQ